MLAALVAGREGDTTTVLLARTNLRSAAAGRTPTEVGPRESAAAAPVADPEVPAAEPPAAPAPAPAARAAAAPVPAAAPPRTTTSAPVGTDTGSRRRRRVPAIWLVAGVVALLLVGLIALLVSQGGSGTPTATGPQTSAATTPATRSSAASSGSSAAASTSTSGSASSSSASSSAPPPAAAAGGGALTAANIQNFLSSYHRLAISDPHQAYTETGPTLRAAESEPNYVAYWNQFSGVTLSNIQATDGQRTAMATVTFTYQNGRRLTEQHRFTLLQRGGALILDSDYKTG